MLKGSLYTLDELEQEDNQLLAKVTIDPAHEIFKGHFPQQPVLPGVCLLSMLKEIVSEATATQYLMGEANNIKFIKPVDPRIYATLRFEIKLNPSGADLGVTASSFLADGDANFKWKGLFLKVQ